MGRYKGMLAPVYYDGASIPLFHSGMNMQTLVRLSRCWAIAIGFASLTAPVFAGDNCNSCQCERCCAEARQIKLPKLKVADPPDAEVAFAIPAVARPGQSMRVSPEALRRGLQESVKKELAESSPGKSAEERLDALEKDVEQMKNLMVKLTLAVEKLASDPK